MSEHAPDGRNVPSDAEVEDLHARWSASWTPAEVALRMVGVATPWYVAAGWALDLFHGARKREHDDIEIAIPATRFPEVRDRFPEYIVDAVGDGRIWENATAQELAATRQTWLRDPATGGYRLDVFREPHDGDTWIYRRQPAIRFPYRDIIRHTVHGIPYLRPELVLLFKAKNVRPKDQEDFETTLPSLDRDQRATLTMLLSQTHPGHPWASALAPTG